MKRITSHSAFVTATILAMTVLSMAVVLSSVDARDTQSRPTVEKTLDSKTTSNATPAELAYPGAPDGVDPTTTGPVSEAFRDQQRIAGCKHAKWPNVPLVCYPS